MVGGVLVMLAAATWALRSGERHPTDDDRARPSQVHNATILVERDTALTVGELAQQKAESIAGAAGAAGAGRSHRRADRGALSA